MHVTLNRQSIEWLGDHHIYFHRRGGVRLKVGDDLNYQKTAEIEPYVGFYVGRTVCAMGLMSLSNSELSPKMKVGRYCSIGRLVDTHFHRHPVEHISTSGFTHARSEHLQTALIEAHGGDPGVAFSNPQRPPPVIEHDVWIGGRSLIMPGVTVGTGAVVAANSVVTGDVAPYEIVAGNPARRLRMRFPDEVVAGLLGSGWWSYKFTDLDGLALDDPPTFLAEFARRKPDLEPYCPTPARMADMPYRV
jgi:acetyltransferase-like isoleucine patch superfamily enzyme